jgi:hypothetical protein
MATYEIEPNLARKVEDTYVNAAAQGPLDPGDEPCETEDQRPDEDASLRMLDEGCPNCGS